MRGYKTYIVAGLMAAASALYGMGLLDKEAYLTIMGVLNGAGMSTLRSGVANDTHAVEEKVEEKVEAKGPPGPMYPLR